MLVIVVSVVMYILGITLVYRATRNLLSPSLFVLYIWFFVLLGGINYYIIEGHSLTPTVVGLSSLFFGLGTEFSILMAKFKPKRELRDVSAQQLSWGVTNKVALKLALIVSVILAPTGAFMILKNSPLFNPGVLKTELVRPGMGVFMRLTRDGLPILSVIWLLTAMKKNKRGSWFVAALMTGMTIIALMATGFKGFVLWFAVLIAIALSYLKPQSHKLKITVAILLILGLIAGLAVAYLTPTPGRGSFGRSLNFLWKRMTTLSTLGLDYVLYELVPTHGFYYGETMVWDFTRTVNDLTQGIIFPNPHLNLTHYISKLMGYRSVCAVTTMIMGDLYANWGLLGVIIGCFLYGLVLGILYVAILRMKKTVILLPFWGYLSWIFVHAASTGAPIAFSLSQFASLCLVYIVLLFAYTYFYLPFAKRPIKRSNIDYAQP